MSNKKKIKVKKKKEPEQVDSLTQSIRDSLGSVGKKVDPSQEQMLVQLVKIFLVGGISTIVDLILFPILVYLIKLNPLLSNIISFIIIFIFGYLMSNKYVFSKKNKQKEVKEYIILNIIGLIFTEVLLFGLVTKLKVNAFLIKVLAIILVIVIKIIIRRFIINKR